MIEGIAEIIVKSLASHGPEALVGGLVILYMIYQNYVYTRDMKEMITKDIESRNAMTQALTDLTEAVQKITKRQH